MESLKGDYLIYNKNILKEKIIYKNGILIEVIKFNK